MQCAWLCRGVAAHVGLLLVRIVRWVQRVNAGNISTVLDFCRNGPRCTGILRRGGSCAGGRWHGAQLAGDNGWLQDLPLFSSSGLVAALTYAMKLIVHQVAEHFVNQILNSLRDRAGLALFTPDVVSFAPDDNSTTQPHLVELLQCNF